MRNLYPKWLIATIVLATSVAPIPASANTPPAYQDLAEADAWATASIQETQRLGLMSGDGNGLFRPLATITREETAAVMLRALQLDSSETTTSTFLDVPADAWSHTVIEALVKSKLMTGDGNGHFRPGEGITREEMAVLLVRAAGLQPATGDKLPVEDRDQISAWAKGYVQTALENGLLSGDGTNFNPQAKALRQEMAKMVFNLHSRDTNNEQTLSEIGNGTVVINGTSYKVDTQLAGLLRPTNSAALTGAKLTFVAEQGTITKITHLALTSSGHEATTGQPEFSGNLVLDGDGNSIEGSLEVSGDYISLKNLTVSGDFLIAPTYAHDFYSKNLQVLGSTLVRGGDSNTVVFEDAKLHLLTLAKPDVRVEPKGSTTLSEVVVSKNGTLAADASVQIPKLTIDAGVNQVSLGATTKIDTLVLPQGSNVTALLPNANLQNIAHFSEKKADGTTAPLPNPSTPPVVIGGGGGGGGYVPTPTPTPTPTESVAVQSVRAINTSTVEVTFTKPTIPQWISFDHGLELLAMNLYTPQPQTTWLISTTPQQAGVSYEVSLNGTKSGKTFQGIAPQVTGMLRHENGQPAEVHNLYVEDADTHEQVSFTVTGHDGRFALSGLTEGKAYLLSYPVGSDLIEVSPGPLAFTYQAGMAPLELSFTKPALQGRVVTPDGAPVQNVLVYINHDIYITNPDGYYFLGGLTPSDTYNVSVEAPTESPYASPEDTEFTYSQTMKEIPDIKLQVPNITGVLVDEDGHSLAGRRTVFFGPYHPIWATTDSQGRFKFYGSKDNSNYSVRALVGNNDPYAEPIDASFQLSNGTADPVRMVLPKATIKGKITNSEGQPVSGAYLKFKDAQDAVVYTTFSQADGSFKAGGFPDGDYKLEVINFSDVVYTGTVTSTKGEVHQKDITIQMMDTTPPVLQSTGPGWEYMYAGEPLSASLNEKGTVCLIPSSVQVNSISDILAPLNTQQSVYNYLSNEGGGEASLDTTNLATGTYRMYAYDDQGNWSALSDKVFTISHDKPPVFILSSKYGQHLPLNPSNRNFRDVPGNVTVGEVLDGLDLAPGVQATLFDFSFTPDEGKDPLQTMMPDHFEIELHSTTGGHAYYSYYFFNREQREPGLAVLGIDESVGLLNFDTSVYRGYQSLNVYAGTTYNDLKNALKLTNETTADFMVADLNQPVVAGFSFLISRGSWAEWITVNQIIERPVAPLTLTSTTLGTLETDAQGNFIAVREIPFGTETSDFLASLTLSNPSAHAELVNAPIGGPVESGPISHAMRLRISDENGGREFTLHLADSSPLLNGLDPYRHAGQLIGGTISTPAHIKAGLLKLAAQVAPGSRVEILTGIGGAPVTDLLNADLTSGMILRVTSWQGVTTDYQIVVTP